LQRRGALPKDFRQHRQQQRAEHHAGHVTHAAEHHHAQHHDRFEQGETFRRDELLKPGEQPAGQAAETRAQRESQQFDVARVDATGFGGHFVLANRRPGAADARILQARTDLHDEQRQQQKQIIGQHQRRNIPSE
jgi:alanine racemase